MKAGRSDGCGKHQTPIGLNIVLYLLLILGAVSCMLPFVWLLRSSIMSLSQIFIVPPEWIPKPFVWDNYVLPFKELSFGRYFTNTTLIVIMTLIGVLTSSTISAYSFARLRWIGRDKMFALIMSSMMLPFAVTLIPTFVGWQKLGLVNSYIPLILPAYFGGGAFA